MGVAGRERGFVAVVGALALLSTIVTIAAVALTLANWQRRFPGIFGWSPAETVFFTAGFLSVTLAEGIGLWLWWRTPRSRSGLWLWAAGLSLGLWFVGTYWPDQWAMHLTSTIYAFRPFLALAILGWPTGRPSPRVTRWIATVGVAFFALGTIALLFADPFVAPGWPEEPLALFDAPWVGAVVSSGGALLFLFVPACAVVVVLARQRTASPVSGRHLVFPLVVVGIIVTGTDIVLIALSTFDPSVLTTESGHHESFLGAFLLTQNYAQAGIAAVGLLAATLSREHAIRRTTTVEVDLANVPRSHKAAPLPQLLDDPSARLLYATPNGRWVDVAGRDVDGDDEHRAHVLIVEGDNSTVALLDCDGSKTQEPWLIETAAAAIVNRAANERAAAVAGARRLELAALQQAVLDATDAARRRLERNLHDGAQQRLIGLALEAKLAERLPGDRSIDALRDEIETAASELEDLITSDVPAVLGAGLPAALLTLAATAPLPVDVHVAADVRVDDELAAALWFTANEAVTNAVKHAHAQRVSISVRLCDGVAELRVVDDGHGGVVTHPAAIHARVHDHHGRLSVDSPDGGGTAITARFPTRSPVGAVS